MTPGAGPPVGIDVMQALREIHAGSGWTGVALFLVLGLCSILVYELAVSGRIKAWVAGVFRDHAAGNLSGHCLFSVMTSLGARQHIALKLPCPLRQAIGRDMCKFRLDALRDAMLPVARADVSRCSPHDLFSLVSHGRSLALKAWRAAADEAAALVKLSYE